MAAKDAASLDRPCARQRVKLRSGRKNARGAGRTKEWTQEDKKTGAEVTRASEQTGACHWHKALWLAVILAKLDAEPNGYCRLFARALSVFAIVSSVQKGECLPKRSSCEGS